MNKHIQKQLVVNELQIRKKNSANVNFLKICIQLISLVSEKCSKYFLLKNLKITFLIYAKIKRDVSTICLRKTYEHSSEK